MAYKSLPVLNVPFGRPSGSVNTSPLIHELKQRAAVQSRTEASRSKSSVQTTKPTPLSPSLALSGFFQSTFIFSSVSKSIFDSISDFVFGSIYTPTSIKDRRGPLEYYRSIALVSSL